METRSMRRNKYTMEQIDRLEQSNQELLEKNQTLQETNSVLSHDYLLSLNRHIFQHKFIHSQIHLPLRKKCSYAVL